MHFPGLKRQLLVNPVHERTLKILDLQQPETINKIESYEQAVRDMGERFSTVRWQLSGGMALPYILRMYTNQTDELLVHPASSSWHGFYREHSALHIACEAADLPSLVDCAHRANFELVHNRGVNKIPGTRKKFDELEVITPAQALEYKESKDPEFTERNYTHRKLRLVNMRSERKNIPSFGENIDSYYDLYVHHHATWQGKPVKRISPNQFIVEEDGSHLTNREVEVVSNKEGLRLPAEFYEGPVYKLSEKGPLIRVVHPIYLFQVKMAHLTKRGGNDTIDEIDIGILEKIIDRMGLSQKLRELQQMKL